MNMFRRTFSKYPGVKKLFLFLLAFPFFAFAQRSDVPQDLLTAPSALAVLSSDEHFEEFKPAMEEFLKKVGANSVVTLHFPDNPTLRKKSEEALKSQVNEKGAKYAFTLTITRVQTTVMFVVMASPSQTLFDSTAGAYCIETGNSLDRALKAFEKSLHKNLKK
jgi:hypothetical protein